MTARSETRPEGEKLEPTQSTERPGEEPGGGVPWKRVASAVLGGALLLTGLRRRSLGGAVRALLGGWLLYTGVSGRSPLPGGGARSSESTTTSTGTRGPGPSVDAVEVERSITVDAPAEELAEYWRDAEKLDRIWGHFAEVTAVDEGHNAWRARGPLGQLISWESRIVDDEPGEQLRWETTGDSPFPNEGTVRFRGAPGDQGTEVTLRVLFDPPAGRVGRAAAERFDAVPATVVRTALRRFKSLVETGEIPTLERNPSGRGAGDLV